jgi:WhiB family redox-sensing transcriptional regulator
VVNPDNVRLNQIAARLDRLSHVPSDVLSEIVLRDGLCIWAFTHGDPPQLTGIDTADRELVARLCEPCPVQDECLAWELRLHGPGTVGVWGALAEEDRRALYPLWRARGEQPDDTAHEQEGGQPQ